MPSSSGDVTASGTGPTPGRGASHASQWRALATLSHVHFEQAHGMCWLCTFGASCALNIIGIVARRVPNASERDFASPGAQVLFLRARQLTDVNVNTTAATAGADV